MYRNKTIRGAPETRVRRHSVIGVIGDRSKTGQTARRDRTRTSYRRARRIRAELCSAATLSSAYRFVSHNDRVHLPLVRTCIEITYPVRYARNK